MIRDTARHVTIANVKFAEGPSGEQAWAHVSGWAQLSGGSPRRISCVIACRDVSRWLGHLLPELSDSLTEAGFPWEITCVDGASTDGTSALLSAWSEIPGFRWIRLTGDAGEAGAILTGLQRARGDAVVLINAAAKPSTDLLPEMIAKWDEGNEIVLVQQGERGDERVICWNLGESAEVRAGLVDARMSTATDQLILLDRRVVDLVLSTARQ